MPGGEALGGIYILERNCQHPSNLEPNQLYEELPATEDVFRKTKDFPKIKPVYHHLEPGVRGHALIFVPAYTIKKILDRGLSPRNIGLSTREALEILDEIRLVQNRLADRKTKCTAEIAKEHSEIRKAIGVKALPKTILTRTLKSAPVLPHTPL